MADVVIGRYLDKVLFYYFNLIGDQLVQPRLINMKYNVITLKVIKGILTMT